MTIVPEGSWHKVFPLGSNVTGLETRENGSADPADVDESKEEQSPLNLELIF